MSPRTPKQFDQLREETRTKILHTAMVLFSSKGFHGTSVDDIAAKAKISKGLIYHYFGSKDEVLNTLMTEAFDEIMKITEEAPSGIPPRELIEKWIDASVDQISEHADYWRLFFSIVMQPDVNLKIATSIANLRTKAVRDMQQLFAAAGSKQPRLDSLVLVTLLDGIGLNYVLSPDDLPLQNLKKRIKTIFTSLHTL